MKNSVSVVFCTYNYIVICQIDLLGAHNPDTTNLGCIDEDETAQNLKSDLRSSFSNNKIVFFFPKMLRKSNIEVLAHRWEVLLN